MEQRIMMELERLKIGLEYCYDDSEVDSQKQCAIVMCKKYNAMDDTIMKHNTQPTKDVWRP